MTFVNEVTLVVDGLSSIVSIATTVNTSSISILSNSRLHSVAFVLTFAERKHLIGVGTLIGSLGTANGTN